MTRSSEFRVEDSWQYDHRGPVRWVVSHLLRNWKLLGSFLLASLLINVTFSLTPQLTGQAFDLVLDPGADSLRGLQRVVLLLLLVNFARGLLDLGGVVFALETLAQQFERNARAELSLSLLGKSQAFHNRHQVGDIMARATGDVRQLNMMISPGIQLIVESIFGLLVPLFFIAFTSVQLLVFPVLLLVAFYFAIRNYQQRLEPVSTRMRAEFGRMNAGLTETITGIELVKGSAQEAQERLKFQADAARFRDAFVQQGEVQARYLPVLLVGLTMTLTLAHGLLLLAAGQVSLGGLVAVIGLVGTMQGPAGLGTFTFALVQLGHAAATRILGLITASTELDENPRGHTARVAGEIEFRNASLAYDGGKPVLQDISFHVLPGETVAIVGQTGSGKSSLTRLVNRTYDASGGALLIDGVDVRQWNLASLRQQISVIEQDVFLFSRSVADNIAFGLPGATREQVKAAARAAQASDFIAQLPEGFDTVIGERGANLSGGQRQRLAIARALLTDPRILVLDDATSAIDSATEDEIQKAIATVLEGRTALLITHRLSQIRRADRILVLDHGRVLDFGTHAALLQRNSLYQRIFARQS